MEVELEPRVKPLGYKVKAMSRESPAQKAAHLLDTDLRNHWSTGTNTKEWILLELDVCNLCIYSCKTVCSFLPFYCCWLFLVFLFSIQLNLIDLLTEVAE